ncbi:hypothetical protein J5N97_003855 [Dioscorea zingiberensis]|uniref:Uncharacterized protein n=1 Tax=Dioscorea zingiberensis TaxID=325984 RepID=A0A9D5D693_9LILI|nr:hypothetical protein J5N97_003855 [Dioscorea zingiberensis]
MAAASFVPPLTHSLLPCKAAFFSPNPNPNPGKTNRITLIRASSSSFRNGSTPETECPVPPEQQPVNEYQALSDSFPFSWAAEDLVAYCSRLAITGASFSLLVGLPVASFGTADPRARALGAVSAGLLAVTLAVLRMYLGWAYVGNRLLSATVEYEETGWYDGQVWVKTPEVLARDRLLGSFSVKPVLSRVKLTLVGLAMSLVMCILLFINIENPKDSSEDVVQAIAGVYNDASAKSFEPDAFCGDSDFL